MDRAGWHTTDALDMPENIILLLPRSPEPNPVENVWRYLSQTHLFNRVFAADDTIIEPCCDAWNRVAAKHWRIMSIGLRQGAH